jgi:tetratricopeptide (TPR) repeat protein
MSKASSSSRPRTAPEIQPAIALHRQGRLREAERIYAEILAVDPGRSDALHLLGLANYQQGRLAEALRLMAAALKANPRSADIYSNYGLALDAGKQHQDALASFDKALALKPDHVQALNNRGLTLAALGRTAEALASWDKALAADPDHAEALHSRGNALYRLKRLDAALADYDRVLALRPNNVDVLNNRGGALAELGRLDEAFESYDRASAVDPGLPEILINKGHVCADRHQFEEALSCYAAAAALPTLRPEAEFAASLVRLRLGQFTPGWRDYEWRWQQASWEPQRRDFVAPLWLGKEPLSGKTILLHAEQGFGDTLQFARYAKLAAALGATVLLEVQAPLKLLMSGIEGIGQIFARGEPLPRFDLHCPLMSLPLAFGTALDTIQTDVPYIRARADHVARWRARLGEPRSLRVGIVWAGSPVHKNNHNRSIALDRFRCLLSAPDIEFVSLQNELGTEDAATLGRHANVIPLGGELRDFADTAAVVSLLDLVVSADTALVHLAGALGRPVWVLLPFSPDFRWLLAREDSPWYPTARLFRQPRFGDWESVLARVNGELGLLSKVGLPAPSGVKRTLTVLPQELTRSRKIPTRH